MYTQEKNERLIDDCKELIEAVDTAIMFDTPIIVKTSPHTELFRCHGCVVTPKGELKLMDPAMEWHDVQPAQANAGYVLQSLYQRLKTLQMRKSFA